MPKTTSQIANIGMWNWMQGIGLTQKDLAIACGVSKQRIFNIVVLGVSPRLDMQQKLSSIFNLNINTIFRWCEEAKLRAERIKDEENSASASGQISMFG